MSFFKEGETYTRRQISDQLGGELQTYLPAKSGRVVALCFTNTLNLSNVILVGLGPTIRARAEMLIDQGGSVPLFRKVKSNEWRYDGYWKVARHSDAATEVEQL